MNKPFQSIRPTKCQRGTILIVALFIVTLVEIVIVGLVTFHRISIHHSRNYFSSIEATNILLAGEDWSKKRILESFMKNENITAATLVPTKMNGGELQGELSDAQGKFNVNNVMIPDSTAAFNNFLSVLLSNKHANIQPILNDIEDKIKIYTLLQEKNNTILPYANVSELRTLPGINEKNYQLINDNMIALPEITALNLNSATAYSLLTLSPELTIQTTKALIQIRDNLHGFSSVDTFLALAPLGDLSFNTDFITVQSRYYISTMTVQYQDIHLTLNSLLKVNLNNSNPSVMVLSRSFGAL